VSPRDASEAAVVVDSVPQLVRNHQQTVEKTAVLGLEELRASRVRATIACVVQTASRRAVYVVEVHVVDPIGWVSRALGA
jgi:hypothetical protein